MEVNQQQFAHDETTWKERSELMKMMIEKTSEIGPYEQNVINNSSCVLSLNSVKQREQSLGG